MLYLITMLLGIVAGIAAGGKISNLKEFKFKKVGVILAAFIIQVAIQLLGARGIRFPAGISVAAYGLSYSLLLFGFFLNRRYRGLLIIGAGCLMNGIVIVLNGGRMPVSLDAIESAGLLEAAEALMAGLDNKHMLLNADARLGFLSDVIYLPSFPGIMMRIVSIGDLIVVAGLLVLLYEIVKGKRGAGFERTN